MKRIDGLSAGIRILCGKSRETVDRIQLSQGTQAAPESCQGLVYDPESRIPAGGWRSLGSAEQELLLSGSQLGNPGYTIAIVTIPAGLLQPLRFLSEEAGASLDQARLLPLARSDASMSAIAEIKKYLRCYLESPDAENAEPRGGIVANPPALTTVTVDPRSRKLIGLHADDWYRFPLNTRHRSPNRICFNIGGQARFFLFINLSMVAICEAVSTAGSDASWERIGSTSMGRLFMKLYPCYPIIRIRVDPGEAYIAPTENVIHDGSSVAMSVLDLSLSLRGQFKLAPALTADSHAI